MKNDGNGETDVSPLAQARARRDELKSLGLLTVKTPIERHLERPKSLRAAITAKCYDCQGLDADPGVKWRIGNCECPECPLWTVRPWQGLEGSPIPKALMVE